MTDSFEVGPIRPPSEAYSLLVRATRNCSWNRCKFCHTYKGERFELRPVEEIKQDIVAARSIQDRIKELSLRHGYAGRLEEVAGMVYSNLSDDSQRNVALWLYAGGKSAFLQDANTLIMRTNDLVEVIKFLKATLPTIDRITSYARSKTAAKKKVAELVALRDAGLSRLHMGLESGYDPLLKYMDKGVTAAEHVAGGRNVVASGISLSEYVILGLGGRNIWREHALETARVLNQITPDFIRVRTLAVNDRMPLRGEVENGSFVRETDEEIVEEESLLIEGLECESSFVSDHVTNLLPEIEGRLPQGKEAMLSVIRRFQDLSAEERVNFSVGRRIGAYERLDDLGDERRRSEVKGFVEKFGRDGEVDEDTMHCLMGRFI